MPELPEVETVRRGLSKLIIGKQIVNVEFNWAKSFPNAPNDVKNFFIGSKIQSVRRRAKVLIIDLDSKYSLVIHLKMTGQLVYRSNDSKTRYGAGHPNDSLIGTLPDKSTRVTIEFSDSKLFFNDQRKFGWMRLLPTIEVPNIDFFKKIGPEPLEDDFKFSEFKDRLLRRKKSNIKSVLLDQTIIAGVGNIYADESLFAAKIHPSTIVRDISETKLRKLYAEIRRIMKLSIELGGSTDRNYVDAEGKKGSYLEFAQVFRREGRPCEKCGTIIQKLKVAGRGTHVCPSCQKLRRKD
ncbi:MAG TPA: bifunctional DNA-formamidopyrimidine glycosylase/DNA-(apurinic or apyrimidinic site) lyase [Candidatus Saccharibacteria bacterium]|nr:bifunctional DNA-formamidopyrimidine glycosylase/DNA-(apurinic or apyrimidinic site) lyase [Candidatus Saccharibacteria bacterium]